MDPIALSSSKQRLIEKLHRSCDELHDHETNRIVRCKVEVEGVAAMEWLACQSTPVKTYWANRNQEFKMAGVGIALEISGQDVPDLHSLFNELQSFLDPNHPDLRFYGGFQFNKDKPVEKGWEKFGAYRFIIPRFELHRSAQGTFLISNHYYQANLPNQLETLIQELDQLQFDVTLSDWEERAILR